MANQLSVKVYWIENKASKEIRKFAVDEDVATSFEYIVGKIKQVFPDLLRKELELFWKDDEEDYVSVSSDDELFQVLKAIPTGTTCLKLFVKVKQATKPTPDEEHPGVVCDSCDADINGIRYKCTVCEDYDLCSSCERKGNHPDDHELLCIKKPRSPANIHVAFARGCMRSRGPSDGRGGACSSRGGPWAARGGPWCGGRGGPWVARGGPWAGRGGLWAARGGPWAARGGPWAARGGSCTARGGPWCSDDGFGGGSNYSFGDENCHKEPENEMGNDKQENRNEEPLKEMVSQLAVLFGLDPEVAVSSVKSFLENFHTEETATSGGTEEHPEGKSTDTEHGDNDINFDVVITHIAESFGLNPELVRDTASSMFWNCHPQQTDSQPREEKKNEEEKKTEEKTTSSVNTEVNMDDGTANSEKQTSQNRDENMETEVNKSSLDGKSDQQKAYDNMETSKKSDDFIVVDQQSTEEKYEQRLGKALRQMEAMGFDNEGGWLRQLLVSKDLSIGRVLDAVNPPM